MVTKPLFPLSPSLPLSSTLFHSFHSLPFSFTLFHSLHSLPLFHSLHSLPLSSLSSTLFTLFTPHSPHSLPPLPSLTNSQNAWTKSIDSARASFSATLLARLPETGQIVVNFDQNLSHLFSEAKYLLKLGIAIPEKAKSVLVQEERFKV
jgi:Dynein heavy chain, N-terminal region 1